MDDNPLQHPPTSSELGQMFNFGAESAGHSNNPSTNVPLTAPSPANLPVYEAHEDVPVEVMAQQPEAHPVNTRLELVPEKAEAKPEKTSGSYSGPKVPPPPGSHANANDDEINAAMPPKPPTNFHLEAPKRSGSPALRVAKKAAPYVVVFAIGLGIYFFYANTFSFTNIFKGGSTETASHSQSNAALAALKKTEAENYQNWISQFFFNVTDPNVIDMDSDVSGNGLTNFQKYLLNLNPKMYDTLGTGVSDGQQILNGNNPWTGLAMTDQQKKIAENYLDTQTISDRIAAAQAGRDNLAFAPYVSNSSPYYQPGISNVSNGNANLAESDGSGEVAGAVYDNSQAPAVTQVPAGNPRGSDSNSSNMGANPPQPVRTAPLTGASTSTDVGLSSLGIDTSVPGVVNIPSIKVSVPVIWSTDPKNFDADLKNGVVHYPGTPLPGEIGTSYISGHSSGYFWDHSQYKLAFARLASLKNGDSFTVTVTLRGGKKATLHYVVGGSAKYKANDPRQFLQSSDSVVALSTCWPINTTAERLVYYGKLTQIEK